MDTLLRDVRHTFKVLLKERTFSATVLLTLAVCVGANVAIFGVVHRVLLDPLPFDGADRLVTLYNSYPGAGTMRGASGTVDFFERRAGVPAFEEVGMFTGSGSTVGEAGSAERIRTMRVTPSFLTMLGVEPRLGRGFTEDEMVEGNHQKVLLTDSYWKDHLAGAPDVVGREVRMNGQPFTIVGVLPEDFGIPGLADVRLVVPIAFSPSDRDMENWHSNNFQMMARLAPGATVEQARAQNVALNDALTERWPFPDARKLLDEAGFETVVVPSGKELVRDVEPMLYMLWAGVGFVLLIGCVNIANLMLARGHARIGEVATLLALGAPRTRVARQVVTEALVMALVGGSLGVAVGAGGLELLGSLMSDQLPLSRDVGIDGPILLFTLALTVGAGVVFGAIPVVQIFRSDLSPVFRTESRGGTATRRAVLVRNALVTAQVALAFVMLIGSGLMLMSFRAALSVEPGFEPAGVLGMDVSLPTSRYASADERRAFWDELLREVRALPGVASAGVTSQVPFGGSESNAVVFPEGHQLAEGESVISPWNIQASPGFFETLGVELVAGRTFLASDDASSPNVMVIDEWLANRYWPDRSPLGERMVVGIPPGVEEIDEENLFTIVGVVRRIAQSDLTAPISEHVGAYYFSYRQVSQGYMSVVARAQGADPSALTPGIRRVLEGLDPELPLIDVRTMDQRIMDSLGPRRVPLVLLGVFAGVAVFLAVVGIYGALAYTVGQRTREIGVRMALGSEPDRIFRAVVAQGVSVTAVGLVVGGVAAWILTRLLESMLFGVEAHDLRVMAAVAVLLALVGTLACVLPARRATGINPVVALGG